MKEQDRSKFVYDAKGFNAYGIHISTQTPYDLLGYDKDGYNRQGYDSRGYNRQGYNKNGFDENGVDEYGTNRMTGEKDPRITLAEDFISSGLTIDEFCTEKGKPKKSVLTALKSVITSPCVRAGLLEALDIEKKPVTAKQKELKEKLLAGEIKIKDIEDINEVLRAASDDKEKEAIREILMKAVIKGDIRILEYKKIFGLREDGKELPTRIVDRLDSLAKLTRRSKKDEIKKLRYAIEKEEERIKTYRAPFLPGDLKRIGGLDESGKEVWLEITPKRIELAKGYLTATDEFICFKTMNDLFRTMLKNNKLEEKMQMIVSKKTKKDGKNNKDEKQEEPEK